MQLQNGQNTQNGRQHIDGGEVRNHHKHIQAEFEAGFLRQVGLKLTPSQEKFCQEYVKCGNATDAYIAAYADHKGTRSTKRQLASRLRSNANIKTRIEQIEAAAISKAVMSRYEILTQLSDIARSGEKEKLKALELLGKYHGLFNSDIEAGFDDVRRNIAITIEAK